MWQSNLSARSKLSNGTNTGGCSMSDLTHDTAQQHRKSCAKASVSCERKTNDDVWLQYNRMEHLAPPTTIVEIVSQSWYWAAASYFPVAPQGLLFGESGLGQSRDFHRMTIVGAKVNFES